MSEKQTLRRKLFLAGKAAKEVPKSGHNRGGRYRFVKADDLLAEAVRVLDKQGVLVLPSTPNAELRFLKNGGAIAKVSMEFEVTDTKTGERFTKPWVGTGFDSTGDKAIYAAQTGAKKTFLAGMLHIPIGTDPEEDAPAESQSTEADRIRQEQDAAAEAPDEPKIKPLPESDLPEPDWSGLARGEEAVSV